MKSATNRITAINLIFLLLLCVSGYVENPLFSDTVYYLAFLIPIGVGMYLISREKPITDNVTTIELKIGGRKLKGILPLIAPTLAAIMITAMLTSSLMGLLGHTETATVNESFPIAILVHALTPALLEELLFRYIPIKMLLPYSERWAVILSSVYFALIHANLFQIPYAFIAGILFALIDIKAESVIPSFFIHFTNNLLSLIIIFSGGSAVAQIAIYVSVAVLAAVSALLIFIKRNEYKSLTRPLFNKGECEEYSIAPLLLCMATLSIAITSLFS